MPAKKGIFPRFVSLSNRSCGCSGGRLLAVEHSSPASGNCITSMRQSSPGNDMLKVTLQARAANRHEWRTVVKAKRFFGLGARPVRTPNISFG